MAKPTGTAGELSLGLLTKEYAERDETRELAGAPCTRLFAPDPADGVK
jgi:hypothetical protein